MMNKYYMEKKAALGCMYGDVEGKEKVSDMKATILEHESNFIVNQMMGRCGLHTTINHAQWVEDAIDYATKITDGSFSEVSSMVDNMIMRYCDTINELSVVDAIASKELYNGSFAYAEGIGAIGNW